MFVEKLYLEITRMCNLECEHCLRGDKRNEFMSSETINNIFKDVKEVDRLLLTGGEPLLAIKQIKEILKIVKENNIKINSICLITNATILNDEVIEVIKELKSISKLTFNLSYDMFHLLELQRLGLLDRRTQNATIFKEQYDAMEYGSHEDRIIVGDGKAKKSIYNLGRARKLTKERLNEINSMSKTDYSISSYNPISHYYSYYNLEKCVVGGIVSIDVNGNVTGYSLEFDEEDEEVNKYSSNVNEIGMINAIKNYIEYYNNEIKRIYKGIGLELK